MSFVKALRGSIQRSFASLPLILIGWSLFMGSTMGNMGLLVMALGQIFAVPTATLLTNTTFEFINTFLSGTGFDLSSYLSIANRDICNLVPGAVDYTVPNIWVAPSYWMAQITFFFSFLLSSGAYVLTMKADENADKEKVERRKSQATLSLILSSLVLLGIIVLRKMYSGCDTVLGIFISLITMGGLGFGWYQLARQCSARDADIFGIIQKILPPSAEQPPPMTCVYTGQ